LKLVYPSLTFAFLVLTVLAVIILWESLRYLTSFLLVSVFVVACSFFAGQSVRSYVEDLADSSLASPQRFPSELVTSSQPTREDLARLKDALGIRKGSLQFKRKGLGVYNVIYGEGKYTWHFLGSWSKLKETLEG
jgi:hypothetical protein